MDRNQRNPDDNWSSSDSCSSQSYSDSDSSVPEWDSSITSNGQLVYIKLNETKLNKSNLLNETPGFDKARSNFKRQSTRRSSRGKPGNSAKIRNVKQTRTKSLKFPNNLVKKLPEVLKFTPKNATDLVSSSNRVKFSESQHGEVKLVTIEYDPHNITQYGRKYSQIEVLFGITVNAFEDGKRLMVSGVLPEFQAASEPLIKVGYWLKQIDERDVSSENLSQVLSSLGYEKRKIKLTFQQLADVDNTDSCYTYKLIYKDFVGTSQAFNSDHELVLAQILRDLPVSVLYLNCSSRSDGSLSESDVIYCYPTPRDQNALFLTRGAFITLDHLIPEILKGNNPTVTSIITKDCLMHVVYTKRANELMLLALPDQKCGLYQSKLLNAELTRVLEFTYGSLKNCFGPPDNVHSLDLLFARFFTMLLCFGYGCEAEESVRIEDEPGSIIKLPTKVSFEQCMLAAHSIPLPKEAKLQVDDALTELEAADYREWRDDPLDTQRMYVIIGCCLYYSGHLLSSHLQDSDLIDIHAFLRFNGFLTLTRNNTVDYIVTWREVYIENLRKASIAGSRKDQYKSPTGRCFLLIVGKDRFLLAALLEAGGCTAKAIGNPPPSPFYVEECESCIDLLIDVGLDSFLEYWLESNVKPEIVIKPESLIQTAKKGIFLGASRTDLLNLSANSQQSKTNTSPEIQSILKRRHHSHDHINVPQKDSSPLNASQSSQLRSYKQNTDTTFSEDSNSQLSNSDIHEEFRIVGRREREQKPKRDSLSSCSDSDWDGKDGSHGSSSFDCSDLKRSIMEDIGDIESYRISSGPDNVLFHFVELEAERGIFLAPALDLQSTANANPIYAFILSSFRRTAQIIHEILQNTMSFKKVQSPTSAINKSLVAIKEHGILLQVPLDVLSHKQLGKRSSDYYCYWVVGRCFCDPEPREVYLCYHESIPQDTVELAYRLSFME